MPTKGAPESESKAKAESTAAAAANAAAPCGKSSASTPPVNPAAEPSIPEAQAKTPTETKTTTRQSPEAAIAPATESNDEQAEGDLATSSRKQVKLAVAERSPSATRKRQSEKALRRRERKKQERSEDTAARKDTDKGSGVDEDYSDQTDQISSDYQSDSSDVPLMTLGSIKRQVGRLEDEEEEEEEEEESGEESAKRRKTDPLELELVTREVQEEIERLWKCAEEGDEEKDVVAEGLYDVVQSVLSKKRTTHPGESKELLEIQIEESVSGQSRSGHTSPSGGRSPLLPAAPPKFSPGSPSSQSSSPKAKMSTLR